MDVSLALKLGNTVFLPISVIFVFWGWMQQMDEVSQDLLKGLRYLALCGSVIVSIMLYPKVMTESVTVASKIASESYQDQMNVFDNNRDFGTGDPDGKSFWDPSFLADLAIEFMRGFMLGIVGVLAWIGTFILNQIIKILVMVMIAVAPLFLSFLCVKQTQGAGSTFVTCSIGVMIMPVAKCLIDMIFVSMTGTMATALFGQSIMSAGLSSLFIGASSGVTFSLLPFLGILLGFMLVFTLALYIVAPFAFLRFISSGSVSGLLQSVVAGAAGAGMVAANAENEFSRGMRDKSRHDAEKKGQAAQQAAQYSQQENAAGYLRQQAGLPSDTVQAISKAGALQPAMAMAAYPTMASMQGHRHSEPASPPIMSVTPGPGLTGPFAPPSQPAPPSGGGGASPAAPSRPSPGTGSPVSAPPVNISLSAANAPLMSAPAPAAVQQPVRGSRAGGGQSPSHAGSDPAAAAGVERPGELTDTGNAPIVPPPAP
jgi:hypothetical protein